MSGAVDAGRPLRVWHVNVGNHAGLVDGVAVVATQLAHDQAELGHALRLIAGADPSTHDVVRNAAGPLVDVDLVATARQGLGLAFGLLDDPGNRPDVVHLHSVFRPVHQLLARRARRLGVRVVLSPHSGLAPALLRRDRLRKWAYGELLERRSYRAADGVHALQLVERDDVVAYCRGWRPVAVIPNPVDSSLLRTGGWREPQPPARSPAVESDRRPRVVLLCRYDVYQKGLDRVDQLARRLPDVDFRVYGHSDKNAPERSAALMAQAPANLRFELPVYDADKRRMLGDADLFLQPSRVEGLSVALVEAMTLGMPCAVSGYVGRSLEMSRRGTALVLDDEVTAAAGQLDALLRDEGRRTALGRRAHDYARQQFDPQVVARRHIEHYVSLLGGRTPAHVRHEPPSPAMGVGKAVT